MSEQAEKQHKVFVLGGAWYVEVCLMFAKYNWMRADTLKEADLCVFIGGADVDPVLYGERKIETTFIDRNRDDKELEIYLKCRELNIPMVGICRGAQFLHVMNGGKLWQHVNNHSTINPHPITILRTGQEILSSSRHHQMMRENPEKDDDMEIVATTSSPVSTYFSSFGEFRKKALEIEAAYYWNSMCFLTQGHPEIGPQEYEEWFMNEVEEFLSTCSFIKCEISYEEKGNACE